MKHTKKKSPQNDSQDSKCATCNFFNQFQESIATYHKAELKLQKKLQEIEQLKLDLENQFVKNLVLKKHISLS